MKSKPVKGLFQRAAQSCTAYAFDYAREAEDFYKSCPERYGRMVFVDLIGGVVVHPDRKIQTAQRDMLDNKPYLSRLMNDFRACKGSLTVQYQLWDYIILNTQTDRLGLPRLLGAFASRDVETVNILDHEIGHQICRNGYAFSNKAECLADVYAAMRHVQRFTAKSPYIRNLLDMRAVELFFRGDGGTHFTSPVLRDLFSEIDAGRDFSGMTIKETAAAAMEFVEKTPLAVETIADAATDFQSLKGGLQLMAKQDYAPLRVLAQAVLAPDAKPIVREWGAVALLAILDGKVMCDNLRILPAGDEWMKLRESLDALASAAVNAKKRAPKP